MRCAHKRRVTGQRRLVRCRRNAKKGKKYCATHLKKRQKTSIRRKKRPIRTSARRRHPALRRNPWTTKDVKNHNKKCAANAKCRRKWVEIANSVLKKTGDEGRAIRIANWQCKKLKLYKD